MHSPSEHSADDRLSFRILIEPGFWFISGLCLIAIVPIAPVAPLLQTFILTWRPELAASLLLLAFLFWGIRSADFQLYLRSFSATELYFLILPIFAFTSWSTASMLWAGSTIAAAHHSAVWSLYLICYIFARYFVSKETDTNLVFYALTAIVLILCLPLLFEYFSFVVFGGSTSIGLRYAKYGEIINLFAPVLLAISLRSAGRQKYLGFATVVIVWLADIGTLSRTAIGLFVVSILAFAFGVFLIKRFAVYRKPFAVLLLLLILAPLVTHSLPFLISGSVPIAERVTDKGIKESTNVRPFLASIAAEMFKQNPLTGIGADNFGREFNEYRGTYAGTHPDDPNLAIAEQVIPERAHNEYFQILAELGVVGAAIFVLFLIGIAYMFFLSLRRQADIVHLAAFVGLGSFLASSVVTSYSFRAVQNGLAFFLILAIASGGVFIKKERLAGSSGKGKTLRLGLGFAALICFALAALSVIRVSAVYFAVQAANLKSIGEFAPLYDKALSLDPENGAINYGYGLSLLEFGHPDMAAGELRKAIENGRATSADYSYLATAQRVSGDTEAAAETLKEALVRYPKSVFIRTRYAVILKDLGNEPESARQFAVATSGDRGQALSWWNLADKGGSIAAQMAFDEKLPPLMDLRPANGMYAMIAERELRFPEEKFKMPF